MNLDCATRALKQVDWFANLGRPIPGDWDTFFSVRSIQCATNILFSRRAKRVYRQAINSLDDQVFGRSLVRRSTWHESARMAKSLTHSIFKEHIDQPLAKAAGSVNLYRKLRVVVCCDLLYFMLENEYNDVIITRFFSFRIEVYAIGHIPCYVNIEDEGATPKLLLL